jgi:hypothetical protein
MGEKKRRLSQGMIQSYSALTGGAGAACCGSNNPKEKIAVAEAIATYSLPPTAYTIGAVSPSPI